MPTLQQMMDIEAEVETSFATFLATIVTAATIYKGDSNTENDSPNLGVVATPIEQGRHQITVPTGTYVPALLSGLHGGRLPVRGMFAVKAAPEGATPMRDRTWSSPRSSSASP